MVWTITGWVVFTLVTISTIPAVWALKHRRLAESSGSEAGQAGRVAADQQSAEVIEVSVIVPARNEELQIAEALKSLLRSENVRLEIIAINDRSTDQTGTLMDAAAVGDPRIQVVHVKELPEGWLGKNHAMHLGSQRAKGKYILFTDGDILFEPGAIRAALDHVTSNKLHHLCLLPKMIQGSLLENVMTTFFGLAFATGMQLHLIRTRWPMSYAGVGAFNLVEAEFYRSFGGHEPIRLDVLDDVKLGKLVKRNHGATDFLLAEKWLSVRWQPSLWGVITGLEKNGFASLNYSTNQIAVVTLIFLLTFVAPVVAPLCLPWNQAAGFAATLAMWHLVYGWLVWNVPNGRRLIPFFLAGPFLMAFAYWRSAVITWRQGGVRWRNSFYPIQQLRAGLYR
ncbi:MAG: glycosyltransferase [Planctomycetaceae bacterium]|nr:glycosyltransferase [Planctomycetaceae bacterium]